MDDEFLILPPYTVIFIIWGIANYSCRGGMEAAPKCGKADLVSNLVGYSYGLKLE
jgi:hypothetical protein